MKSLAVVGLLGYSAHSATVLDNRQEIHDFLEANHNDIYALIQQHGCWGANVDYSALESIC